MGLIQKILGGFLAFLGGIAKLFGLGQKDGFYMELEEGTKAAVDAPAATNNAVSTVANNEVKAPATAPSASVAKVEAAPTPTSTPVITAAPEAQPSADPQPKAAPVVPKLANFATDYLVNPNLNRTPRRRPGPSVSPFKNMAKQMGRRSASMG
ncbi:MAG: hypothetical protein AAGE59_14600 [Cyanobacteria bacterium P01_F01_bin.86]